jgi:tetratricopeptide (TPR) repeat protein
MTEILYLHIGVPKTGSTSIQQTLFQSREALKRHGFAYFDYSANHSQPIRWLVAEPRRLAPAVLKQRLSADDLATRRSEVDEALKAFLADSRHPKKIISGEDISALSKSEATDLKNYVNGVSPCEIKIIVYVRNFYDFLDSMVQWRVRQGASLNHVEASLLQGRDAAVPRYKTKIQTFIEVFGRDNVDVRAFDSNTFKGKDLLTDFCHALNAPEIYDDLTKIRANLSVSDDTVRILSKYNELFPLRKGKHYNPERTEKIAAYFDSGDGAKFRVTNPDLLAAYEKLIAEDKEFLRECLGKDVAATLIKRKSDAKLPAGAENGSLNLDYLFHTLGRVLRDLESYEKALDVSLVGLAERGRGEEGRSIDRTIKFIGSDRICRRLSRSFLRSKKFEQALALAERAVEIDPKNPENYSLMADVYSRQEAWAEAERFHRKTLALDPTNPETYRRLSGCLRRLGRPAQAAAAAQKANSLQS